MEKQKPWPIGPQKDINIEGAIKCMKEMRSICDTDDGFVPQVYDMAIAALRRAESENKPLTLILDRIHAIPPETFVGTYGDFELVEAIKDSCCEAVEEVYARPPEGSDA